MAYNLVTKDPTCDYITIRCKPISSINSAPGLDALCGQEYI
jgi:hypothetical protein